MGRVRLISPRAVALVTVLLGATITGTGLWLQFGPGWALIFVGVVVMVVAALGIDTHPAVQAPRRPAWAQQARTPGDRQAG